MPLENLVVRSASDKPFAFALSSADHEGGVIKSAKAKADGGMQHGSHEKFLFAAENEAERARWLQTIRSNVKASEAQSRMAAIAQQAPGPGGGAKARMLNRSSTKALGSTVRAEM